MCKRDEETVNHLLLHFPFGRDLWGLVFALFGVEQMMSRKVFDLLACWEKRSEETSEFHVWNAIPLRFMWSLWMKQNSRTFKKVETLEPNLSFFFF